MNTNRLYTFFSLIVTLALVSAGVLAIPMLVGALNQPPAAADAAAGAEQARLTQRRGEWYAGQPAVAASDSEILRFVTYSNRLAKQARLDQRRGEWYAGEQNLNEKLDLHDRHPNGAASDSEIARFVAYSNSLAEQARLAQRRGEWQAGNASQPATLDVENARLTWRASK